jgi:hypothetical protein
MHMRAVLASAWVLAAAGGVAAADPPRFRTEAVWVDPVVNVAEDARDSGISHVLFVNRCPGGCIFTPDDVNDARTNKSSIIGGQTRTLSEFNSGDDVFNAAIECIRDVYSPYDVQIVTDDPGDSMPHHEAVMAGFPEEVGRDSLTGGIAPATCEPLNNVISFSFANGLAEQLSGQTLVETLCWTVSQESAHSFGLPNHVYDCHDPMTYLAGCGRKYFRNRAIQCGRFDGPEECTCNMDKQNSHERLLAAFGEGTPPPPPVVTMQYPEDGQDVEDNFSIFFTALDPRLVARSDVYLNGTKYLEVPGWDYDRAEDPYSTEAPDYPDGYIEVEVKSYDEFATEGNAKVTVLKGAPCEADSCGDGFECTSGHCVKLSDEGGGGCCAVAGGQKRGERFPLVALSLFAAAILLLRRRRNQR